MSLICVSTVRRDVPSSRSRWRAALSLAGWAALCWLLFPSCGSSSTTSGGSAGVAGTVGSGGGGVASGGIGGASATGGTTGTPGTAGASATGGTTGTPGTGGASATGGTTGTPGTGGASATGGTIATGGTSAAGGSTASGGNGVGGGAQSGGGSPGAGGGVGAGGFALTSPVLTEGGMFPAANTCAGVDQSPELDWTPGPATAQSYALVLTDMAINLVHWVVWDIPVATRSLPAMLATAAALTMPAGAHQVSASGTGYMGPCPSGAVHTYVFDLHAVDAATLPAVPAKPTSAQLKALVLMHSLGKASLSGQSNAKRP